MSPAVMLDAAARPGHAPMRIGGRDIDGVARIEVRNPAHPAQYVGTVVRGTPADVHAAIAAARTAQPAWGTRSFVARARTLSDALDRLDRDLEERAVLYVRENGRPLADARAELAGVAARQRLSLDLAATLDAGRSTPGSGTSVSWRPYGVVVSIVPWNAPVSLGFSQIVAALLAGNAIVVKPPETCPLALMATIALFEAALPPGLVNVVTGLPTEIGDALTRDGAVDKIAFTGSVAAARTIMANAAQGIRSVTLELGGNDAAILLPDIDLGEATVRRMARAVFRMSGQICMAIKRVYVPEALSDRFVAALSTVVNETVIGDGVLPGVTMGPMHTAAALARAKDLVEAAGASGGRVHTLGRLHADANPAGHFMRPVLVSDACDAMALMAEEQFCPALPIATYRTLDEAVERANATAFGLGGSVWGADVEAASAVARRLEAGTVFVNAHGTEAIDRRAPYGGMKQSGIGRKSGLEGVLDYTEAQTLAVVA